MPALAGETPTSMLGSEADFVEILNILGRIEHGVIS